MIEDRRLGMEDRREVCKYHPLTEATVADLKAAVHTLMDGQNQLRETVVQLGEGFKSIERIERHMFKIEDRLMEKNKEQDVKIDQLRAFMYKLSGIAVAVVTLISVLTKFIGG